jgi:hypothetical protein
LQGAAPLAQATSTITDSVEATPAVLPETGAAQPPAEQMPPLVVALLIAMAVAMLLAGVSVYMLANRSR